MASESHMHVAGEDAGTADVDADQLQVMVIGGKTYLLAEDGRVMVPSTNPKELRTENE